LKLGKIRRHASSSETPEADSKYGKKSIEIEKAIAKVRNPGKQSINYKIWKSPLTEGVKKINTKIKHISLP